MNQPKERKLLKQNIYKTNSSWKGYRSVKTVGRLHCKTKSNRKSLDEYKYFPNIVFIKIYCSNYKYFS